MEIPERGWKKEDVFAALQSYKVYDLDWKSGRVWAYVYDPGDETAHVVSDAYNMFMTENGLDPTVFPSMLKLETDIVRMMAGLLRGDEDVVGHITTGGTESIILAVKTARDWARAKDPANTQPEIILHLAAQSIVRAGYGLPRETFDQSKRRIRKFRFPLECQIDVGLRDRNSKRFILRPGVNAVDLALAIEAASQ